MTQIFASEDCGNSPKNLLLKELTVAFAEGNTAFILSSVTPDIRWNIVGDRVIEGKDAFAKALERLAENTVEKLTIHHIATHGKAGAVDGSYTMQGGETHAFCEMYEFANAKGTGVKEITSYIIKL